MPPRRSAAWLDEAGFDAGETLLLRRTIDSQGKSRAWINGSPATVAQLREAADHLVEIHGQHAWQSLTRPAAVRDLLDAQAGVDVRPLAALWTQAKAAGAALDRARTKSAEIERERERLAWQIGEVDRLAPARASGTTLNAEHQRLAHAQALIDAARTALDALSEADGNAAALAPAGHRRAGRRRAFDARLAPVLEVLQGAQAQLQDAAHSLSALPAAHRRRPRTAGRTRCAAVGLDRPGAPVPARRRPSWPRCWRSGRMHCATLDAATDLAALERALAAAERDCATRPSASARRAARARADAGRDGDAGDAGAGHGRRPLRGGAAARGRSRSPSASESVEFLVAGHAGSTPRPLAKVASGGELSRLALAIAVTTRARPVPAARAR